MRNFKAILSSIITISDFVKCYYVAMQHSLQQAGNWTRNGQCKPYFTPVNFYNITNDKLNFLTFSVLCSKPQAPVHHLPTFNNSNYTNDLNANLLRGTLEIFDLLFYLTFIIFMNKMDCSVCPQSGHLNLLNSYFTELAFLISCAEWTVMTVLIEEAQIYPYLHNYFTQFTFNTFMYWNDCCASFYTGNQDTFAYLFNLPSSFSCTGTTVVLASLHEALVHLFT